MQPVLEFPSPLQLDNIPLFGWAALCSSVLLSVGTWGVSAFGYWDAIPVAGTSCTDPYVGMSLRVPGYAQEQRCGTMWPFYV